MRVETGDTTSGTGSIVDTEYDSCACSPLGKVKRVSQPYAPGGTPVWTTYTYDALGRTTRIDLPGGGATTYLYQGKNTTVTDPAGKWKTYATDALGNLVQVTEPAPEGGTHETYYAYNLFNQLAQVQMPRTINGAAATQTRTFNYDLGTGRLNNATNPENGTVSYVYNADGTLLRKTDASGQKIEFSYDTYQRPTQKRTYASGGIEDGCRRVDYSYDTNPYDGAWPAAQGQLVARRQGGLACTGGQFTEMYKYATGGLMSQKLFRLSRTQSANTASGDLSASFTYDADGGLKTVTYPAWQSLSGSTWVTNPGPAYAYSLDTQRRPSGVTRTTDSTSWVNSVVYNTAGALVQMNYPVGANPAGQRYSETRAYNTRGQMTRLTATPVGAGSAQTVDLEYRYSATNNNGRITQMKDWVSGEEISYQYDSLNRMILAETTGPEWGQSFSYDGFGNMTSEVATKGTAYTSYLNYDAATNRILGGGHTYDTNGNLTAMPNLSLSYDVENRTTQAVHTLNGTERYGYDPSNQRVWKQRADGFEEVHFYGPDGARLGSYTVYVTGSVIRFANAIHNLYFAGKLIWSSETNINAVVQDRLGTSVLTNGTDRKSHFPYGEQKQGTAYQFATYRRDATGLDYAVNRYYSSQVARFTTTDPSATADPSRPQSWNQYVYANGDPVNWYDPDGLDACSAETADFCIDHTERQAPSKTPTEQDPLRNILLGHLLSSINTMDDYANAYSIYTAKDMSQKLAAAHQAKVTSSSSSKPVVTSKVTDTALIWATTPKIDPTQLKAPKVPTPPSGKYTDFLTCEFSIALGQSDTLFPVAVGAAVAMAAKPTPWMWGITSVGWTATVYTMIRKPCVQHVYGPGAY